MSNLYIGIMSGTSLDGVDVALCEIDADSCKLLHSYEHPFPPSLKKEVLSAISGFTMLHEIGELDNMLGQLFTDAIKTFLEKFKINASEVNAIGLHGQTLWHSPDTNPAFSMQLGDANVVAAQTRIKTVADFRRMDIANGGQGAPFAPAFHQFLFSSLQERVGVLNIGGMANLTLLGDELKGWDTGCGNVLLDMWIWTCKNQAYDKDGEFAKSGEINSELLKSLIDDEYFKKLPPKSTGREYFNDTWLANHLPVFQTIKDEDVQRTLLELTALSIANDVKKTPTQLLIVCGGGAKNTFLMHRLQELCSVIIKTSDEFGVHGDALEAMAFAWLAYKRVNREEVQLSSVTGAKKDSILGGVYE